MSYIRALPLLLCLLPLLIASDRSSAQSFQQPQSSSLLSVVSNAGVTVTANNRFDGNNSFIELTAIDRNGQTLWDINHNDGTQETANSIWVDDAGEVFVGGTRSADKSRWFWIMKLTAQGVSQWEHVDSYTSCTAVSVTSNSKGDAWIAGSCYGNGTRPARVVHYDTYGNFQWEARYDGGGRNYVQGMSVDQLDRASVIVQVQQGSLGSGPAQTATVVFDKNGNQLTVY